MAQRPDFETVVTRYYEPLYRFAFSLTRAEADACDLTQQTFYVWAVKGHSVRDPGKVKSWLFTTLYRQFLESRRRHNRFPHHELDSVDAELPVIAPDTMERLDSARVVEALARLDEVYQAPVALYYLEDLSYQEIAGVLEIPMGTVKSRISRGISRLHQAVNECVPAPGPRKDVRP